MKNVLVVKNAQAVADFKATQLASNRFVFPDIPFDEVEIQTPVPTIENEWIDCAFSVYVLQRYIDVKDGIGKVDFDIDFGANYIAVRGYSPNTRIMCNAYLKMHCFNELPPSIEQQYCRDLFNTVIEVFDYVLNHSVELIEKQTECKKSFSRGGKTKAKHKCRYITSVRYTITGGEKRKRSTPNYSLQQWSVRGFYRTYKSGKKVFIKPSYRKRRCIDNITAGRPAQTPIVYKM